MVIFGLIFLSLVLVDAAWFSDIQAPYFKHAGIDDLRDGILALSSQKNARFALPQLTNPPQQYHHAVVHSASGKSSADAGNGIQQGGEKASKGNSHHTKESGQHGDSQKEEFKKHYGEDTGHKKSYKDGDKYGGSEHKESGGGHKGHHKSGSHKDAKKGHKGYHDLHHKDEKKHQDSFYKNGHEEGKFIHFGKHRHKHGKEAYKKKNGKWVKEGKQESSHKKDNKENKQHAEKHDEKHGSSGGDGQSYDKKNEYAGGKSSKGGKTYVVHH